MQQYRLQESDEKRPIEDELQQLTDRRRSIGQQIYELNDLLRDTRNRISDLIRQRKAISGKYYEAKKRLIMEYREQERLEEDDASGEVRHEGA